MILFLLIAVVDLISQSFPDEFDLRKKYPYCPTISTPLDQKECGSCWAFSTTSATSDRLCIQGWTTLTMAPEHPIQCDSQNTGCDGGFVGTAFDFHNKEGLVTIDCKAYMNEVPRTCSKKCDNKETITSNMLYRTDSKARLNSVDKIKEAIYTRGSVVGSYMVYDSFNDFYPNNPLSGKDKYGIFRPQDISGEKVTFHAVKFIGWGITSGIEYWLIQNSWGSSWADGGYFRIQMKVNTAQIEEDVFESLVPPYSDRCFDYVDCDSCNAVTQLPKENSTTEFEDGRCGFCQATDQCIEVTVENVTKHDALDENLKWTVEVKTPKKGVCPDIATSVCPLDDCLQMSNDPYRCVQHSGCGYCAATRKCRKGNTEKQNVGRCNDWMKTSSKIPADHKNCSTLSNKIDVDGDFKRGEECLLKGSKCGYCLSSSLCLSANQFLPNMTKLGRCDAAYWWYRDSGKDSISDPTGLISSISVKCDYSTKERCDFKSGCKWDATATPKKCISGTSTVLKNDNVCLGEKCGECNTKPECRYCTSTQSCLSFNNSLGDTTHTTCSLLSDSDDTVDDICNDCGNNPSCYECALKAKCGWWEQLGLCMAGRVKGPFDPRVKYADTSNPLNKYYWDNFTSFKMNCPFVIEYSYTAEDAALLGRALPSFVRLLLWAVIGLAAVWAVVF